MLNTQLQTIGEEAFYSCSNLTEFYISENISNILTDTFNLCPNLKTVIIDNETICENVTQTSHGNLLNYATTIKVPQGANCNSHMTSSFTK